MWCKELTHLKRPWCWERLEAGGEGDDRRGDGWMASQTQWTWVWTNSGSWWWTGKPGVLQSMGSQRARHDWATELNWVPPAWISFELLLWDTSPNLRQLFFVTHRWGRGGVHWRRRRSWRGRVHRGEGRRWDTHLPPLFHSFSDNLRSLLSDTGMMFPVPSRGFKPFLRVSKVKLKRDLKVKSRSLFS